MRVRPNQLFTFMIPSVLDLRPEEYFVEKKVADSIIKNVERELVNPFGLYSLSPEDPLFHPEHENPEWYHKDAAYHNGTIWEWNTGAYITASVLSSNGILGEKAAAILQNYSKMIQEFGCAGSLSENIHARPDSNGNPKLSGTFSQAWSVAEFNRNIAMDLLGFHPQLVQKKIKFCPCLPANCKEAKAALPFGNGWIFDVQIKRKGDSYHCAVKWIVENPESLENFPELTLNEIKIKPNEKYEILSSAKYKNKDEKHFSFEKFGTPSKWITFPFVKQNLNNEFCGAEHKKDYLFNLIKSGRMNSKCSGGKNTGALEWYFDSKEFEQFLERLRELGVVHIFTKSQGVAENQELQNRIRLAGKYAAAIKFLQGLNVVADKHEGEAKRGEKALELLTELQNKQQQLAHKRHTSLHTFAYIYPLSVNIPIVCNIKHLRI